MEEVTVAVRGISLNVLVTGPADGTPVLLVHGNCSSADFWRPLLRHLPPTLRIVAPDLRGYGRSETAPVDATRGLRDFADDVAAVLDAPGLFPAGGAVTVVGPLDGLRGRHAAARSTTPSGWRRWCWRRRSARTASAAPATWTAPRRRRTSRAPGPARPTRTSSAGCAEGDRNDDGPTSPLSVLRTAYVADPASLGADEQLLLDTVLSTATGDDNYPGDSKPSENWPGVAPGDRGVLNTMAPNHFNVAADLVAVPAKPPITWVRGDTRRDRLGHARSSTWRTSARSAWCRAGRAQACPPQPMVSQTRAVLERYGP